MKDLAPMVDDPEGVSYQTSLVMLSDHAGTQLDGLCHATYGLDNHWYNGFTVDDSSSDFGPRMASAEHIPPVIAKGVLIDVPRYLGVDQLTSSYAISAATLESALGQQHVGVGHGDVVLIRTGTMRHWGEAGHDHSALSGPDSAGITLEAARWLVEEKGAIVVGSDNSTLEVVPAVDGDSASPVHVYLLVDQGVHMGELHNLEGLATDSVYEFTYIALCPPVRGTTAGFALRPIAIA
jgi:kynurenine formamidase